VALLSVRAADCSVPIVARGVCACSDNEAVVILVVGPLAPVEIRHVHHAVKHARGAAEAEAEEETQRAHGGPVGGRRLWHLCGTRLASPDELVLDFLEE
jgi:hypothetical protein